jgi:hypothetical protein
MFSHGNLPVSGDCNFTISSDSADSGSFEWTAHFMFFPPSCLSNQNNAMIWKLLLRIVLFCPGFFSAREEQEADQ